MQRQVTLTEIMEETGKKERAVRNWIAGGRLKASGESRRNEKGKTLKLYWWPMGEEAAKVEAAPAEVTKAVDVGMDTYNGLRKLEESGEITLEQADRLAKIVESLRKARGEDSKALKAWEVRLDEQQTAINNQWAGFNATKKTFEAEASRQAESWKADSDMAAEWEREVAKKELELKTVIAELLKAWGWVVKVTEMLTDQPTWKMVVEKVPECKADINMLNRWAEGNQKASKKKTR